MEIHELNTFSGTLGSGDYFATDNGTDTSKVSAEAMFAPLNARIDNIIAGPAPSAEEVVDARRGATALGSTNYPSLGDAIRGQVTDLKSDISEIEHGASLTIQRAKSDTNQTWGNTKVYFYLYVGQTLIITNNGATPIWFALKDASDATIGNSFQIASGGSASITISTLPDHVAIYADTYPINVNITSVSVSTYLDAKINALKESTEDVTIDYLQGKICYANLSNFDLTQNKYYSNDLTPLTPADDNTYHIAQPFTVPAGTYAFYGVD